MMSDTMRPIRETISLSDALALLLGAAVPIERTGARAARRGRRPRDRGASSRVGGRPAVRSRGDGWLCRPRRRHLRRGTVRPEDSRLRRQGPHGTAALAIDRERPVRRDRDRRADAGRRRRGGHGRGNRTRRRDDAHPGLHAGLPAAERRPPRRGHRGGPDQSPARATC